MRTRVVEILERVLLEHGFEMPFIQNQDVIETLPTNAAQESLHHCVHIRGPRWGLHDPDVGSLGDSVELPVAFRRPPELAISITDDRVGAFSEGRDFTKLLGGPGFVGRSRDRDWAAISGPAHRFGCGTSDGIARKGGVTSRPLFGAAGRRITSISFYARPRFPASLRPTMAPRILNVRQMFLVAFLAPLSACSDPTDVSSHVGGIAGTNAGGSAGSGGTTAGGAGSSGSAAGDAGSTSGSGGTRPTAGTGGVPAGSGGGGAAGGGGTSGQAGEAGNAGQSAAGSGGDVVTEEVQQWGTSEADIGYGVAVGVDAAPIVVGQTMGELGANASAGGLDLFLEARPMQHTNGWVRQLGTAGADYGLDVTVATDGSVFVVGETEGVLGQQSFGRSDAMVGKWDATGEWKWTTQWGTDGSDGAEAIALQESSGAEGEVVAIFVAGRTNGDLTADAALDYDAFVTKLDPDGGVDWSFQWGSTALDGPLDIVVDSGGSTFIVGETRGQLPNDAVGTGQIFCTRLDPDGAHQWTTQWGASSEGFARAVALTTTGALLVAGYGAGEFDGQGSGGAFVSELSKETGVVLWTKQFGASTIDEARALVPGDNGTFYVSGITYGKMGEDGHAGRSDVFLQKRDHVGELIWTRQWGTDGRDFSRGMARRASEIYIAGYTDGAFSGYASQGGTDNILISTQE